MNKPHQRCRGRILLLIPLFLLTACKGPQRTDASWPGQGDSAAVFETMKSRTAHGATYRSLRPDPTVLSKEEMKEEIAYLLMILESFGTDVVVNNRLYGFVPTLDQEQWLHRVDALESFADYYHLLLDISKHYEGLRTRLLHPEEALLGLPEFKTLQGAKEYAATLKATQISLAQTEYQKDAQVLWNNTQMKKVLQEEPKGPRNQTPEEAIHTGVTEDGKTAYLQLETFYLKGRAADGSLLGIGNFLDHLNNYETLILDLRGNPGGQMRPWREELLPRLIEKTRFVDCYVAARDTPAGKRVRQDLLDRLQSEQGRLLYDKTLNQDPMAVSKRFESQEHLPSLMGSPNLQDAPYLGPPLRIRDTLEPKKPIHFKGKIYLLADVQVTGSSDTLTHYLKSLGIVTVVGKPSKGDGVAQDFGIHRMVLPHTGLIFQVQTLYGYNLDGSSNYERGNAVDDFQENGVELDHVLNLIRKERGEAPKKTKERLKEAWHQPANP
ncbi:hypothetical protein ABB02_00031 [Clostridiaceae bacterium JG1575]|nr:hypothetical protein ABB02_00031 [Clostridiaceae bacterium JG1575]